MSDTHLPAENIYAHTTKLRFFLSALASLRTKRNRGLRILDLGCGNGWAVTRHLAQSDDEVLGIDMHAPSIEYAKRNFSRKRLEFRCATAEALYDELPKWDAIVLADVLEHLVDPRAVLENCVPLLAEGGQVLVAIPNGQGPFEMESWLSRVPIIGAMLLRLTDLTVAVLNKYVFRGLWTRAADALPKDMPYNHDSPHVQFKSHAAWLNLFSQAGYQLSEERNLAFIAGPFSNYLFGASSRFCAFNANLASRLPSAMVSNWAFVLESRDAKS